MRATLAADRHVLGMIAPRERARLVGPVADGNAVPVGAAHRIHSAIAGLPRGERRHRLCRTIIAVGRSEEHTSETPVTNAHLVCRLLLEKKKKKLQTKCTHISLN